MSRPGPTGPARAAGSARTAGGAGAGVDAVVVGAGPNGLTAAALLARRGLSVQVLEAAATPGGGSRSGEVTLPGFLHDRCAAVFPFAALSPAFAELGLEHHGLVWDHGEAVLAHPLGDGRTAVLWRDLARTAAALGVDGGRYRRLVGPLVDAWPSLAGDALGPLLRPPRHPVGLARFGVRALPPATWVQRHWFRTDEAAALWAGAAAHAIRPLGEPLTSAFALALHVAAHVAGWPVARGGAQRVTDALVAVLRDAGGELRCDRPVRTAADLPPHRVVLFDLAPRQVLAIAGDRLGHGAGRRWLARFRHGPAAFKIDYALDEAVPWRDAACHGATTLHLGGTAAEIARAEAEVAAGRHPERPFVLVAQQDRADPSRVPAGKAALWAYCHVPAGSTVDMTEAVEAQIERFAPGFRDLVLARRTTDPAGFEAYNASYVGGDIAGGSNHPWQLFARPRPSPSPYRLPWPGAFLCSASTPPGGGVHGMAGYHAARAAIAWLDRQSRAGGRRLR